MPEVAGNWEQVFVAGHPCSVYHPPRKHEHGFVLIYLHGVHRTPLAGQSGFLEQFDRHGLTVFCPQTRESWWTNQLCPAFDPQRTAQQYLLQDVLPFIRERCGKPNPSWALLGTSMGGQGALRLAYRFPDLFPVASAIAPAIDFHQRLKQGDEILAAMYDTSEDARQETAILHIHPLNWPRHQFFCCDPTDYRWWDGCDRLRMKLHSLGIPFQADLETSAGGHGFQYYNAMAERAVGFAVQALERERMRVF